MQLVIVVLVCLFVYPAQADQHISVLGNGAILTDQFSEPGELVSRTPSTNGLGAVTGNHMWLDANNPRQLDVLYSGLMGTFVLEGTPVAYDAAHPAAGMPDLADPISKHIERAAVMGSSVGEIFWLLLTAACTVTLIVLLLLRLRSKHRLQ